MDHDGRFVQVRWPDSRTGPYLAQLRLEELNGRYEVVELRIGTRRDNRRITGEIVRGLRLSELAAQAASQLAKMDAVAPQLDPGVPLNAADMPASWHAEREAAWAPMVEERNRQRRLVAEAAGGSGRYAIDHFERVAAIYRRAYALHQPPTKAVATELGITSSAAAKQVSRARDKGLLPPTTPGRAAATNKRRKTK